MVTKHVLFVDDEPHVLQGLKRMLRGMRKEWTMYFAEGGQAGLALLAQNPCDVVVSDMRMPAMDGAQFLTEVKKRHPNSVRLILSGQSEEEAILRSIGPSHQFLAKPCDPETLKNTVARACALRDLLNSDQLRDVVSRTTALPTMPSVYTELLELLGLPDCSMQDIAKTITRDIGLTAKILQLVNSAYFGLANNVTKAEEAVKLLGLDVVKSLAFATQVFVQFDQTLMGDFSLSKLWRHSMGVAVLARAIAKAEHCDQRTQDDAFLGGLLHDAGKLIIASNMPEDYANTGAVAKAQSITHWQAELQTLGTTHGEIGAYLFGLWGLPNSIIEAVAYHHMPSECITNELSPLTAVHVADALYVGDPERVAKRFKHGDEPVTNIGASYGVDEPYITKLGLHDRISEWRRMCLKTGQEELADL